MIDLAFKISPERVVGFARNSKLDSLVDLATLWRRSHLYLAVIGDRILGTSGDRSVKI